MTTPAPPDDGADGWLRGVAVAIVSENDDPEGMGRVKLTYPWRDVEDESYWARIAVAMAGDDRGTYFLPEKDDEVLVAFDNGDIRHPYVIGSLWNGQQSPPADNEGSNDVRKIRSRSGHELVFDDADAEASVEITTAGGHTVTLDDASGSEAVTIEDSSGSNTIEFDATQGSLSIEAGATLSIEAPQIEITGSGSVRIESSGMLTLEGALITLN